MNRLYCLVGSLGEYEDQRHILLGVFDSKELAQLALNTEIERISNGRFRSSDDLKKLSQGIYDGDLSEECGGYNLFSFMIEEVETNKLEYIVQKLRFS